MTESAAHVRVIENRLRIGGLCSITHLSTSLAPACSQACRICSLEWTPARAFGSSYSRARIPTSTLPTLIWPICRGASASSKPRAFRLPILMDTFVRLTSLRSSHRENPRPGPGRGQRVRPRVRHAIRIAREHGIGSGRSRGGGASRWRRYRTPPASGWPRPRTRNRARRERLRRRDR